ncbi:MAG TPA: class I SAM-dependent DNA methyltransferase [Sphingomonas sp.]|uniref:class I SAM-dependent DNA methyltransferase n=1 Tax=Sphingomonas sp. TaxID=28214 RepID=UPI002EDAC8EA
MTSSHPSPDRHARAVVQRLWGFCNVLKDDGVSYGDYVEQLTFLLFLKMEEEATRGGERASALPEGARWRDLLDPCGLPLEARYINVLQTLSHQAGTVGRIFARAQNRIQDAAKLKRLIGLIDAERWSDMDIDVKGAIYEGLLERNAEDVKSGAGQYFTPRPLLRAITAVMGPVEGESVCDPACGTGGFLLEARRSIGARGGRNERRRGAAPSLFAGWEIVPDTARLCLMSLHLRGIPDDEIEIHVGDALLAQPERTFDLVLTNPPFGRRSSMTFSTEADTDAERLVYGRPDFVATTSNKQLNFLQHVMSLVSPGGRAAVIVPDSLLSEGGAGEAVRRALLTRFDVHTLLRLPPGIFYAGSVKSSVLFFDRPTERPVKRGRLWTYDMRTGRRFSLRGDPLTDDALADFVRSYGGRRRSGRVEGEHFGTHSVAEALASDRCSLDLGLVNSTEQVEHDVPAAIAAEIIERLEAAADAIRAIEQQLKAR